MSLLRKGGRRTRASRVLFTALALGAFQVLAIVTGGAALAVTGCTYNPATQTINITIDPGQSAGVAVEVADTTVDLDTESPAGAILFNNNGAGYENGASSTQCGSATNSNTVSIVVLGSPSNNESFTLENDLGDDFNTAITWAIDLGSNTVGGADVFVINGNDDTDDNLVLTDGTFDLNGGGGPVLGNELYFVTSGDGAANADDVVDGSALASTVLIALLGSGDDWVAGGTQAVPPFPLGFGESFLGGPGDDTVSFATRTTSTTLNNVAGVAGHDINADCDLTDPGDEVDTLLDDFENLEGGSGNDCLIGAPATDEYLIPGDGDDDITGQVGDTIDWSSSSAAVTIDPGASPEATGVGQGTDTFTGPNAFVGSAFDDTLIWAGTGAAGFCGGDGTDRVDATARTTGQVINLDGLDDWCGLEVDDLENALGGSGNDTLTGNDIQNRLEGNDGDDTLHGAAGNDFLIGSAGNDTYDGGLGADKVSFKNSPAGVDADMLLGFATGEGDDTLLVGTLEILVGSQFNDTFTGGGGTVATNFRFIGNAGNDLFTGSGSNDTLKGGGGKDTLRGVGGDDTLLGAAGNDRLYGGGGTDVGKGGDGKDTCKSIEIQSSCGKKGHPKRTFHSVAAKLARLG